MHQLVRPKESCHRRKGALAEKRIQSLVFPRAAKSSIAATICEGLPSCWPSTDYIEKHGEPESPGDLVEHRCLSYGHTTSLQRWHLTENGESVSVSIASCMSSNNGDVLREAAVKGIGIAMLPTFIVGNDIAAGRLKLVLPNNHPPDLTIHALYAPNRYLAAKTRVFIDFLVDCFGKKPPWDDWDRKG